MTTQQPAAGQALAPRMPRPGGIVGKLLLSMGAGFWGLALLFALLAWLIEVPMIWYLAYTWIGLDVLLTLAFLWGYSRYRHNLPKRELAHCPVGYEQDFQLDFVVPDKGDTLYLWLNLDISSEVRRLGGQKLLVDVQLAADGQWRPPGLLAYLWRASIRDVNTSGVPTNRSVIPITLNERYQHSTDSSGMSTGRMRCIARVAKLGDLHPGQRVTLRGRLHSADVRIDQLVAEAFVAGL